MGYCFLDHALELDVGDVVVNLLIYHLALDADADVEDEYEKHGTHPEDDVADLVDLFFVGGDD